MYSREETAREEEERRVDAAAPAEPTDPDGDFEWRDDAGGTAPSPAPHSFAPDPADGDFEWRDDELDAPTPTPPSFAHDPTEEDLEWRDDELAPRLDEHAAATRLQAAQRGRAARARVAQLKAELRRAETEVACPTEDTYEDEFEDDFEVEESAPDDERERHAAATKLQAAQRGKKSRGRRWPDSGRGGTRRRCGSPRTTRHSSRTTTTRERRRRRGFRRRSAEEPRARAWLNSGRR